jgi:hypothetical protein
VVALVRVSRNCAANKGDEKRDFRKLKVWQNANEFVLDILCDNKWFSEFGAVCPDVAKPEGSCLNSSQIPEGYGHQGDRELVRFLRIAHSSSSELSYHLLLGRDLDYLDPEAYKEIANRLEEVKSMLVGLTNTVSWSQ